MNEITIGIIALCFLLGLFLSGLELAFAMIVIGVAGFSIVVSPEAAMGLLANDFFDGLASYGLTVIPLFVLMGQIAFNAGLAKHLYDTCHRFFGHIPGGLSIATVVGAAIFKSICGSMAATVATFASVAIPEMDRYGYSKKLSTGIVAIVGGTLGALLPPSVTLIVLGIITEVSIGQLFMAGIVPGLLVAFLFLIVIIVWCRINPALGPKSEKFSWRERTSSLPNIIWPLMIFIIIMGGFIKGFFTPTEAGSIGAFAVLILCIAKRDLTFKGITKSIEEALRTACMVLFLIVGSTILGHFIAVTTIPAIAAEWIVNLPIPRFLTVICILLVYLLGGSFIDDLAFMILATPIFFPVFLKLGYNPLWVGIMITLTAGVGSVIPPVAVCVFIIKNITKIPMSTIYAGVVPFLSAFIFCMILLFMFPQLTLYLPSLFVK
ncbi:MAG TPA: TRAP transporter large permease [Syntrophorhabdaceae bacterium]|nr:TRAP transporter large permease [Syntrophorhabdaceae bacterium]HQM82536.1 TRAP transporter large permease [Syntrophorhabdaceae bacterium]